MNRASFAWTYPHKMLCLARLARPWPIRPNHYSIINPSRPLVAIDFHLSPVAQRQRAFTCSIAMLSSIGIFDAQHHEHRKGLPLRLASIHQSKDFAPRSCKGLPKNRTFAESSRLLGSFPGILAMCLASIQNRPYDARNAEAFKASLH